jgi:hypothetical protein
MKKEERYYAIEFYASYVDHKTEKLTDEWHDMHDPFNKPYHFKDEQTAIHKAIDLAKEGRWGIPIQLRVIKHIITHEKWYIHEFMPKDYYQDYEAFVLEREKRKKNET